MRQYVNDGLKVKSCPLLMAQEVSECIHLPKSQTCMTQTYIIFYLSKLAMLKIMKYLKHRGILVLHTGEPLVDKFYRTACI